MSTEEEYEPTPLEIAQCLVGCLAQFVEQIANTRQPTAEWSYDLACRARMLMDAVTAVEALREAQSAQPEPEQRKPKSKRRKR